MKLYPVVFLFAPLVFLWGSCTKELSRENTLPGQDSVNFYAVIDGIPWQADSLQQVNISDSGIVSITGIGKSQDEISMVLPAFRKAVYAVNSQTPGYAQYNSLEEGFAAEIYLTNTSSDQLKAGGTVSITDIDTVNKTISGTFQFKAYQESNTTTKTVTAGFFNQLPYSGAGSVVNPGGPGGGISTTDTLSAIINDTAWAADQVIAASQNGVLIVSGSRADGSKLVAMYMPAAVTPGTYTLNYSSGTYFAAYDPDPTTILVAQANGTLKITENDTVNKHVTGTFSFVGASLTSSVTASITNGYFSCNY